MAQIKASNQDKVYTIKKWLGVNENPDGDTGLKMGEASTMTNFKITNDNALQKRPGTQNAANLLTDYSVEVATTATDYLVEDITTSATFAMFGAYNITDGGLITLESASGAMNYANHATFVDDYYRDPTGAVHKFVDCVVGDSTSGIAVTGGQVSISSTEELVFTQGVAYTFFAYDAVSIIDGVVMPTGNTRSTNGYLSDFSVYKYFRYENITYQINRCVIEAYYVGDPIFNNIGYNALWYGKEVTVFDEDTYTWQFKDVTIAASSGDAPIQGLWSGRVGADEYLIAACDGRLWALSETDGVWTKINLGTIDTTNKVHVFGFNEKAYILNGVAYMSWDAVTHTEHTYTCLGSESGNYYIVVDSVNYKFSLSTPTAGHLLVFNEYDLSLKLNGVTHAYTTGSVTTETNLTSSLVDTTVYNPPIAVVGYRPIIYSAVAPTGVTPSSTYRERINMLNGLRRVRYSPAASATAYQLPETGLSSVDYVRDLVTGTDYTLTTHYTVNLTTGVVTFVTAPANGTDTIEIAYTYPTTYRADIEAMTLSEFFNGANDNRVFVYGDGTNVTYYSDIDYDGQARADYFPDLNVVHIGEANTPITSMLRHHNRLLAFKEDSAYSIAYGTITLVTGNVTAGFYVSTINKGLGSAGYAQAQLIENKVRTLDGRSIYEWTATDSSGNVTADQRNANPISEKVDTTIKQIDLAKAITYFDKIDREYYIVENGTAIVQNTDNKAWYIYRDFPAVCMIVYKDELYFGTADGFIRHVSRDYRHDIGSPIQCYWESGSMDFGASFKRKYSDSVWIVLKPEDFASVNVTVVTDKLTNYEDVTVIADYTAEVATGFFNYLNLNYEHFSYNINGNPQTQRRKIKVKNFTWYKLIFSTADSDTTATVLRAEIKARETGVVK